LQRARDSLSLNIEEQRGENRSDASLRDTHPGSVPEALYSVEDTAKHSAHGEGAASVVQNAPWARNSS